MLFKKSKSILLSFLFVITLFNTNQLKSENFAQRALSYFLQLNPSNLNKISTISTIIATSLYLNFYLSAYDKKNKRPSLENLFASILFAMPCVIIETNGKPFGFNLLK